MAILHMIIIDCVVPYLFLLYMIKSLARVIKFNVYHQVRLSSASHRRPLIFRCACLQKDRERSSPYTTETATVSEEAYENQLSVWFVFEDAHRFYLIVEALNGSIISSQDFKIQHDVNILDPVDEIHEFLVPIGSNVK